MIAFLASLTLLISPHAHYESVGANYRYAPMDKFNNGYPEAKYNEVIATLHQVYDPIIATQGGSFYTQTDWTDGAVNMWAFRLGNEFWLEIPGGMARYHLIEEEGFIISLCHELGHLLGGEPKNGDISFEGQSDYFANQECSEKLLSKISPIKPIKNDHDVRAICAKQSDKEICRRILAGSKSLSSYYAELENVAFPQLDTPSEETVSTTLKSHPPSQCRLDTLLAGYLKNDRPPCWYAN